MTYEFTPVNSRANTEANLARKRYGGVVQGTTEVLTVLKLIQISDSDDPRDHGSEMVREEKARDQKGTVLSTKGLQAIIESSAELC